VIILGMVMELVADLRRWRSDKKINTKPIIMLQLNNGEFQEIDSLSQNINVGDILVVKNNMQVLADCIVIDCEDPSGQCFISTSNLDGERNLKPK
jgi:P-type E1-E2 ATPase